MSIISSDGLSLLVNDLGGPRFSILRGVTVTRLDISQKLVDSTAIAEDAWRVGVSTVECRLIVDCTVLATDESPAVYVRSLAFEGTSGTFSLMIAPTQTLDFDAFVTDYKEIIAAGQAKQLSFRLESTGAVTAGIPGPGGGGIRFPSSPPPIFTG